MKPKHTYCFYMINGEHLMLDADSMFGREGRIELEKLIDGIPTVFMVVYRKSIMAWEIVR